MSHDDSDYELLTEHLGYPPVSLLDDIINTVNVLADRALDSVEQLLLSIPPQNLGFKKSKDDASPEDAARLEIESGTHKLETLLTNAIDRNFDKLEIYAMRNILTFDPPDIRPHVQLAHYDGLDFSAAGDDVPSVESITALRRRVQASQRVNLALQRRQARNDALLKTLRETLGATRADVKQEEREGTAQPSAFGFLHDKPALSSIGSNTPITTTAEFALSQLSSLRALSTSLRNLLPALRDPSTGAGANESWRRERAEYVEQSSRKYLENAGGLELGSQGEVRDGEYQGEGRNLSRGEVEGLEQVVTMLGEKSGTGESRRDGEAMDET